MSNIPKSRSDLLGLISKHFEKLWALIENLSETQGKIKVDDEFTIKDIVVIRVWWLEAVQTWIKDGRKGKEFPLPAEGFSWRETPALNSQTAKKNKTKKIADVRKELKRSNGELLKLIESLSDKELTQVGQFEWAGKWPVMRWVSVGSSSQYDGASKLIRKALKRG